MTCFHGDLLFWDYNWKSQKLRNLLLNPKSKMFSMNTKHFFLNFRVGGVLIPTRSFGDFLLKSEQDKPPWKQVISAVPQLQTFHLDCQWEFVVVGSDGVWDAMSNDAMVAYVRQRLSSHSAQRDKLVLSQLCEQILDMCCAKTVGRYGKNSCDNMTIIIIWFDHDTNKSDTSSSVVSSCVSR